jgi:hypothetical protein
MSYVLPLVIELGEFRLRSATPWDDLGWFVVGLLLLTGLSFLALWRNRRARPDPFV